MNRKGASLDIQDDGCDDERRIGRLRYAFPSNCKTCLYSLQRPYPPLDLGHQSQRRILDQSRGKACIKSSVLCHFKLTSRCRRVKRKTDRKDFYTRILEHRDLKELSDIQLAAHASDFVLAGSETSSTCLSTITYYLLKTPYAAKKVQEEVRGAFASYDDINAASIISLVYLHAIILEGLRIYPPLPFATPRVVPEGGDTVDGHFLPAGVRLLWRFSESSAHKTTRPLSQPTQSRQAWTRPTSETLTPLDQRDG